jgi:hypothetical protein
MPKKMPLVTLATVLIGTVILLPEIASAEEKTITCTELAKAKHPDELRARRAWAKECNEAVRRGAIRSTFSLRAWQRCGFCDNNAPWD